MPNYFFENYAEMECAPLWDSEERQFQGLITISDYIHVVRQLDTEVLASRSIQQILDSSEGRRIKKVRTKLLLFYFVFGHLVKKIFGIKIKRADVHVIFFLIRNNRKYPIKQMLQSPIPYSTDL